MNVASTFSTILSCCLSGQANVSVSLRTVQPGVELTQYSRYKCTPHTNTSALLTHLPTCHETVTTCYIRQLSRSHTYTLLSLYLYLYALARPAVLAAP